MKLFEAAIKTAATKEDYLNGMRYFKDFTKIQKYEELIKMKPKKLTELIEDYILHRRETNSPNSTGFYYYPIQTFLEMNDVLLNFKKLKRLFPSKVKSVVERGWFTDEIEKMLKCCSNTKQRAIIHFEAASGGRVGIFDGLLMKHLLVIDDPDVGKCYAITGYADEREEYTTFLTPEATAELDNYLNKRRSDNEVIDVNSPVFRSNYAFGSSQVSIASSESLGSIVRYVQHKSGLRDPSTKKWNRYPVSSNHGFRHRFDEILKSTDGINPHLAEKMFAHTSRLIPLDAVYNNPNTGKRFEEYKKLIFTLSIDQTEMQKIEMHKQQEKITELEKQKTVIANQAEQLEIMQDELERVNRWMKSKDQL